MGALKYRTFAIGVAVVGGGDAAITAILGLNALPSLFVVRVRFFRLRLHLFTFILLIYFDSMRGYTAEARVPCAAATDWKKWLLSKLILPDD